MITCITDPPVPSKSTDVLFAQTILLKDGEHLLGRARWAITAVGHGVVQLLEFWIDPQLRRAGHGRRLMRDLVAEARAYHKTRGESLRRMWVGVGHKSQVVGRSFLTSDGFHHIATTAGLLVDEDLVVYVKSFD